MYHSELKEYKCSINIYIYNKNIYFGLSFRQVKFLIKFDNIHILSIIFQVR
jgi:hypothetical protein